MSAHAMILAAGRGERMRPLTDSRPKPLLAVRGQALIDWHVQALVRGGLNHLVVNTAWLGAQLEAHLNRRFLSQTGLKPSDLMPEQLSISYSHEGVDFGGALDTAGGIARALPWLGNVFWVLAGDVFIPEFVFAPTALSRFEASGKLAHLWLVPNPAHNPGGDFGLSDTGLALSLPTNSAQRRYTFSTVALYRRAFFDALPCGNPAGTKVPLAPLLRAAMDNQQVSASLYLGPWTDVGTPARLAELNPPLIDTPKGPTP